MFVKLLAAVTLILSSAMAQPLPAEVVERDKPYGGHPRQLIDINSRPLSTPKPAIVIVHGGSWQAGDKRTAIAKTKYFLSKGFAVAAMNYRLHPEVTPREQAQDVADAAVWLAKNASAYGIDPRQIYLVGHAAGGHLVSLVGTDPTYLGKHSATPADLGGIVTLDAAVYDVSGAIAAHDVQTPQGRLLRQVFTEKSGFWSQVSPITRIAGGQRIPPFLLSYSAGKQSYQTQERPFAAALRRQGGIAILYEALGRNEESIYRFFGQPDDPTTEAVLNFIRREADIPIERKKKGEKEELPEVPWLFTFEAPETDERGRRLTGTQIGNIIAHENRLFAGNAHPNETKESRRGQVLRLDAREERWKLDLQLPRGYTRVASLNTARFSNDSEGRPIETLNYLLAGASYENERGKPAMGGLFIRTPSGVWTKQTLGMIEKDAAGAEVSAIGSWRDKSLGKDLVFAGASPAPLGIYRGVYDAAASG
ncbi:MAG: alpha/beta hydrolase, partial [Pseudomonadota bacterium]